MRIIIEQGAKRVVREIDDELLKKPYNDVAEVSRQARSAYCAIINDEPEAFRHSLQERKNQDPVYVPTASIDVQATPRKEHPDADSLRDRADKFETYGLSDVTAYPNAARIHLQLARELRRLANGDVA